MSIETVSLALLGFALVFLNGFFVAAEFAIVKTDHWRPDAAAVGTGFEVEVLEMAGPRIELVRVRPFASATPYDA